ncbi:Imm21 family immunity protein [Nonomuraea wenchangensis]|uniref:Imm21 family immunity protein n=1 Tax=Nonomuraea wenchangensis TaxID=568860 RepID=UPI000B822745|nr:Imm21 family immunity protein [Nonomuraea wenchangensis]
MRDLIAAVMAERRVVQIWAESSGGPLVLVAGKALNEWTGADGDDYELACAAEDLALIPFGTDEMALVLWEEPARTTYLQRPRIFVQWVHADPGCDVERVVSELGDVAWEQGPAMDVGGPMVLLDAAVPGAEVQVNQARDTMDAQAISVEIEPGRYRLDSGEIRLDERTCFRCYRLVAVAESGSGHAAS